MIRRVGEEFATAFMQGEMEINPAIMVLTDAAGKRWRVPAIAGEFELRGGEEGRVAVACDISCSLPPSHPLCGQVLCGIDVWNINREVLVLAAECAVTVEQPMGNSRATVTVGLSYS